MKYIRQFGIILAITFVGELLKVILPFPIPASIYGLLLMLFLLTTHILPLDSVKEAGNFLIEIMPLMFIPPAVELMVSWNSMKEILIPLILITIITTVLVMGITGITTQFILHKQSEKTEERSTTSHENFTL